MTAWSFFRDHYLMSLPEGVWHKPPIYESPRCHYEFIYDLAAFARNVEIMPRSFAKSTLIEEFILTLCFGRAPFKMLVIKSADDFIMELFTRLQFQIDDNARIVDDFGRQKPSRSEVGIWSKKRLFLRNGFQLMGRSVMGKLLGPRPQYLLCDDAEFDEKMRVAPAILSENFRRMWFNQVIPMLDAGCAAALVGTLFTRKAFIYHMATTDEAEDPTVAVYNRVVRAIENEDGEPLWPAKFPREKIEELRATLPPEVFAAQYMNDPASGEACAFTLHKDYSYYTVMPIDETYMHDPLQSESSLVSWSPHAETMEPTRVERPFGPTMSKCFRLLVADPIKKPSSTSDFACMFVIAIERSQYFQDVWWLLDCRYGRPKPTQFLDWIWELGRKWRPRLVAVESIGIQRQILDKAAMRAAASDFDEDWIPRIYPVHYSREFSGDLGKPARIAGLGVRYEYYKIKYPRHLMHLPGWRDLEQQTREFTIDMLLMKFDDAIDTVAITQFVPKKGIPAPLDTAPPTLTELLAKGVEFIPGTRVPILTCLNADELTPEMQAGLDEIAARRDKRHRGRSRHRGRTRRARRMFRHAASIR